MYINIFNLCGLMSLAFCAGYFYCKYKPAQNQDQDHKPGGWLKIIVKWFEKHSS